MDCTNTDVLRILLIEEDEDDYQIIRQLLHGIQDNAYQLVWLNSFDPEVLQDCRGKYDTAIVDHQLSGLSGMEAIRTLGEICTGLPVILISGLDFPGIQEEIEEAGVKAYLNKNELSGPALCSAILKALGEEG